MPPAPQQSGPQQEAGMGIIWIIAGIFVLVFGVWYFAHTQLMIAYLFAKRFEIALVQFFIGGMQEIQKVVVTAQPDQMTFGVAASIGHFVGQYLSYPIAVILLFFAIVLFYRSSAKRYREVYTMDSLLDAEIQNWPQNKPVFDLDLVNQDIKKGPWAMAMAPMEFARRYRLIQEHHLEVDAYELTKKARLKISLREARATRIFTLQLGKLWKSPEALPDHARALYAIFAAMAAHQSDEARKFIFNLAESYHGGAVDFSGTDAILKKYQRIPLVVEVTNKHAYVLTVMSSMLELARMDGVLSSADFLWLKSIDRRLWYMLNCVGRQTAFASVAGPFAHWLVEKELGCAIRTPMVEQAVRALDVAIHEMIYKPEEQKAKVAG